MHQLMQSNKMCSEKERTGESSENHELFYLLLLFANAKKLVNERRCWGISKHCFTTNTTSGSFTDRR